MDFLINCFIACSPVRNLVLSPTEFSVPGTECALMNFNLFLHRLNMKHANMPGEFLKGRVRAVLTPELYLKVGQGG